VERQYAARQNACEAAPPKSSPSPPPRRVRHGPSTRQTTQSKRCLNRRRRAPHTSAQTQVTRPPAPKSVHQKKKKTRCVAKTKRHADQKRQGHVRGTGARKSSTHTPKAPRRPRPRLNGAACSLRTALAADNVAGRPAYRETAAAWQPLAAASGMPRLVVPSR